MACLAAVNFSSFPIFTSYIEPHPKTSANHAFPSLQSRGASFSFISSACIWSYAVPSSLSSVDLIRVPSRDVFELLPYTDVRYCPRTLCGYWVGPDTEDGWGFVEAFICECL